MRLSCTRLFLVLLAIPVFSAVRVFPEPREIRASGGSFQLDDKVVILLPSKPSEFDSRLARLVAAELSSRHGFAISEESAARLPTGRRFIVAGTIASPLVKEYCAAHALDVSAARPGPEGYVLRVTPDAVVIAGSDERGAFYGYQSLRQLIESGPDAVRISGAEIRDWPAMQFRGIKLYLPGRDNIAYFKRFVRDYMAPMKCNKLIIEMNAAMRLDRHPELNAGSLDFARDMELRRMNDPPGLWFHGNNSSHWDTADGGILEKQEVADLVRWAEENYIEVIPELPSLTHSYYLLARHRELAEVPQEEWPDTYCPSLPAVYNLLFDVYDEYLEVMKPKMVHIGHDEWRMPWGVCPRCRNKDPRELYAQDVNRIYDYLKRKGIRTAMWSDHLLENVRGVKLSKPWWDAPGYDYKIPGSLSPEQVKKSIPKDILMFNWLWGYTDDPKFPPVTNEERLSDWGFEQIYANFEPSLENFAQRTKRSKIVGGAPSAWLATTEFNFGKDRLAAFSGCAELVWSGRERTPADRAEAIATLMPALRRNLSAHAPPSLTEPVVAIDISPYVNAAVPELDLKQRKASRDRLRFDLVDPAANGGRTAVIAGSAGEGAAPYTRQPTAIPIGRDASSIVFLHALAKPARSREGYDRIFAFEDSADLLGWYEIEYADGLVNTIPLRYQWNILDLKNEACAVAYLADRIPLGKNASCYAFEWTNPRLGKTIKEVRLRGSDRFQDAEGKTIPGNAVILAALSIVPKREKPPRQNPPFPK